MIEALGPEGTLINVARGSVVDENALVAALSAGRPRARRARRVREEPHPSPLLLELSNVIVQPHHGSGTVETRTAIGQLMIDNLDAHFAGRPLLSPVRQWNSPGALRMTAAVEVLAEAFKDAGTPFIVGHPGGERLN